LVDAFVMHLPLNRSVRRFGPRNHAARQETWGLTGGCLPGRIAADREILFPFLAEWVE
jgi:hypothetical protein